jgi:periplasmic divalent cation tolerance protein
VRNEIEASSLGEMAIEHHLAACANIFPIQSLYTWQSEKQSEQECVLMLKTTTALTLLLQTFVKHNHSYEVPCIMHWEVEVNEEYGKWIEEAVEGTTSNQFRVRP